ncbi:chloride channel protein [Myxacorys almedinensis]|uniref:CBS domain-containing protein n=1 Tax=Myxacorys almedinensis A TaxID=2690445 RepID=A0A8J8CN10_9CYAN|nr:chloride channel protein [Myxacorys almedinensis]NDJ19145.1 CBS domain-containing protein [Myxacorys almedinensis A]
MSSAPPHVLLSDHQVSPESTPTPLLSRLHPPPETIVLMLAVLIGGGAGLGVVAFRYLIEVIHRWMLEDLMGQINHWGAWSLACVPMLGGILVGLMRWGLKDFGTGISGLMTAVQSGKELSPIKSVGKAIAASVSLGSGASLGPEGPSVEIGAHIGMFLGQLLKVSQERQRLLLGAGAAAGLSAGFNAPIAGVFFALEVVLGTTFETSAASVVVLAAVVAALITQIGLGGQPAFDLPAYEVRSPLELPLYLGLGLFACVVSIAYTQFLKGTQTAFQGQLFGFGWLTKIPREIHPVMGGLCVGLVALKLPQVLGVGYDTIEAMLRNAEFSVGLLVTLLIVKLVVTGISLGSGLVGGVFAPAMFLGASLGTAYGKILPFVFPMFASSIAASPAYAMVGMAAVLAASVNAPLTAVLLLFEMTRDYRIVLPLMAAVGLSVWLAEWLNRKQAPQSSLKPLESTPDIDPLDLRFANRNQELLKNLSVAEAMQPNFLRLSADLPLPEAGLALIQYQRHSALVVNQDEQLVGIVTLQDVNRAIARWEKAHASDGVNYSPLTQKVNEVCTTDILYAHKDEPLIDALDRMTTRGLHQLPVIDSDETHQIIGLLEQEGITLACNLALTRESLIPYLTILPPSQPAEATINTTINNTAINSAITPSHLSLETSA